MRWGLRGLWIEDFDVKVLQNLSKFQRPALPIELAGQGGLGYSFPASVDEELIRHALKAQAYYIKRSLRKLRIYHFTERNVRGDAWSITSQGKQQLKLWGKG
jgi:hypothetical protein